MAVHLSAWTEKLIDFEYIIDEKPAASFSDCLSKKIWDFYSTNTQNYKLFDKKIRLKNKLSETLSKYFNEKGLKFVDIFISGSTVNGFATLDSDIDLCFIVTDFYYHEFIKSKKLKILSDIEEILDLNDFKLRDCQLIEARVPILRYIDSESGIQVEINVNNEIGIRNTRLLYCYSKRVQVRPAQGGALSSYTVELMVIFYLQNCSPPLLPCLQQTNNEMFDPNTEISLYKKPPDLWELAPFQSLNRQSLSQLFIGFFEFYLYVFDFKRHVASVRLGKALVKDKYKPYHLDPNQWEYICIEEPFSRSNTGRTVYDSNAYNIIIKGFRQMYENSDQVIDCKCHL